MVDLSPGNESWENLDYYQTHEWWEPHNYREVLPALLALLVSYVEMAVFDDLGRLTQVWHCGLSKGFKNLFPNLFVNDFCIFLGYLWITFAIWKLSMSILRRLCIVLFFLALFEDEQQFKHRRVWKVLHVYIILCYLALFLGELCAQYYCLYAYSLFMLRYSCLMWFAGFRHFYPAFDP